MSQVFVSCFYSSCGKGFSDAFPRRFRLSTGRKALALLLHPRQPDRVSESIVISGIGAVTAIGCDASAIARSLRSGRSGVVKFSCLGFPGPFWFGDAGRDDRDCHDLPDRALRFAGDAAVGAVADSGLDLASLDPSRVGVIVSSSKGLLGNLLAAREAGLSSRQRSRLFAAFSGDTPSRHIARMLALSGPALNYPAACATGIASLVPAIYLLKEGILDAVLTGSTESAGNPLVLAGFASMGALDPELSRPFDRTRNGFNAGEGAAVMVLERESSALQRGVRPLARLAGWDLRADGHSATSVEPGGHTLEYSIRRALARAGWSPGDVEYINAHGTGTRLNDAVEAAVIARVFESNGIGRNGPLVSSLKPYIGHLLGASSSVELALAVISLNQGYVPPTLRLKEPDPEFSLNHVVVAGETRRISRFLKISLGFGGHTGVVAIELPN